MSADQKRYICGNYNEILPLYTFKDLHHFLDMFKFNHLKKGLKRTGPISL